MKALKFLLILLVNLILIIGLLEVGLRLSAQSLPGSVGVAVRWVTSGDPYTETWQPAWQQNRDHYYIVRPNIDNELQYGSPSVTFTVSTIELWDGGGVGFRTDPVDFFVDAVVVGDSFGFCFTEKADCWVDQLASQTDFGMVNLSQPVTGTRSHAKILSDFGAPLEPALVIWQFFGNDFNDDYGLATYRDEIEPITPSDEADSYYESVGITDWLRRNSALIAVIETITTGTFGGVPAGEQLFTEPYAATVGESVMQFGSPYELQALDMTREENQIGYDLSRAAFESAQAQVSDWGGQIVVVIIPTREEVYETITAPIMGAEQVERIASARDAMHTLCDALSLTCFDPIDVFTEQAQNGVHLYHTDDMHLNPTGNAVLADALADWLDEQGIQSDVLAQRP